MLPTLSVGRKIRNLSPKAKIVYIGSTKASDRRLVTAQGVKFIALPAGKWRRYFDVKNILDIFITGIGFIYSLFILIFYWPNRVFVKGGYVGVPVGLAAWMLRRPIILHESDAVMGAANRFLARFAQTVCVSFPVESYNLPEVVKQKMVYTSLPVNEVFYTKEAGDLKFGLKYSKPIVLVMGGSQGARPINKVVQKTVPNLVDRYQVVHLAGGLDYQALKQWSGVQQFNDYYLFDFLPNTQVASLMKRAAVIVSRAGATAIAEIAASSKPAILIPLLGSANNHQYHNAKYLSDQSASVMIEQEGLTPEVLIKNVDKIIRSDLAKRLSFNISNFIKKDSAKLIANIILE